MDTGDITPMISTPIVSRMLPPSIFGSPAGSGGGRGRGWKSRNGGERSGESLFRSFWKIHKQN